MPTVTIAIPTFERDAYLRRALDSALAQSFTDFEICISDNSETDAIKDLVATYDDPRIRYDRNASNIGPRKNWIRAITLGSGKYVASLHDDDEWEPEFLERCIATFERHPDASMVFCDYIVIDEHSQPSPAKTKVERERSGRDRLPAGPLQGALVDKLRTAVVDNAAQPAYAAVLSRSAVLGVDFPEGLDLVYDIWITYQLLTSDHILVYVPEPLTRYRVHGGNLTAAGIVAAEDTFFSIVSAEQASDAGFIADLNNRWGDLRWGRATRLLVADDLDGAQKEFAAIGTLLSGPKKYVARFGAGPRVARIILRQTKQAVGFARSIRAT